ncbi:septum formation protein Maf [bacterium]|nr:septum formation protein Maf [bacterium]
MKIEQNRPIVLASGSPRRKEYLERYGLKFEIITGNVDEVTTQNESPPAFSQRMAEEKARDVEVRCGKDSVIIAADTIVVFENEILGKPGSNKNALPMLQQLNGNQHEVITSYFVLDCRDGKQVQKSVKTKVLFNRLPDEIIRNYADSTEPLDKAGAYSIQGVGTILVKSIEGSYNNVVGLPIEELFQDLLELGVVSV